MMSREALGARPQMSEVTAKPAVASAKTRRRPKRSANVPTAISTVVQAIV